jgi:hypothetical protein
VVQIVEEYSLHLDDVVMPESDATVAKVAMSCASDVMQRVQRRQTVVGADIHISGHSTADAATTHPTNTDP